MAEILGIGCTHRPVMLRRNEDWTGMMKASLADPDMPEHMKNPASWPEKLREELGNDWGASTAARYREVYRAHFAEARQALDAFKPDLIVMWGDDQYENFKEDIVPPFAVLAYEDQDIQPWAHRRSPDNPWNEPKDTTFRVRGHIRNLDPPSPNPHRCMQFGAATARIMADSPYRVALMASSSWSHSFLTEKHWQLWPDVAADRNLFDALQSGDYAKWHGYTTDQIEDSGQHEVLNWFCLLGAMEALGRKPDKAVFLENWAFVSPVVFAHYQA